MERFISINPELFFSRLRLLPAQNILMPGGLSWWLLKIRLSLRPEKRKNAGKLKPLQRRPEGKPRPKLPLQRRPKGKLRLRKPERRSRRAGLGRKNQ